MTPCRLQEPAWLGETTHAFQEVCVSHQLQVTWLLTFGAERGGTPDGVGTRADAGRRLRRPMREMSG